VHRRTHSSSIMVEEAHVYVQGESLKTCATLPQVRFVNSPITRAHVGFGHANMGVKHSNMNLFLFGFVCAWIFFSKKQSIIDFLKNSPKLKAWQKTLLVVAILALLVAIIKSNEPEKQKALPCQPSVAATPAVSQSAPPASEPVTAAKEPSSPPSNQKSIIEPTDELSESNKSLFIAYAQEAIQRRLKDPESAEFDGLQYRYDKATGARVVCGSVNAKNSFGGYIGYERFVSDAQKVNVLESDMKSSAEFNKVWNKLCR
jgi:hypothetical protein